MKDRIVIDNIHPTTTTGAFPAKAVVGEVVGVSADIYKDGHDVLAARVRWRLAAGATWNSAPLAHLINDEWRGTFTAEAPGMNEFVIDVWSDFYATWRHKVLIKLAALQDVQVELDEAKAFFASRAAAASGASAKKILGDVAKMLGDAALDQASRVASAITDEVASFVVEPSDDDLVTSSRLMPLWVDRERALFGAWYEAFPRSFGGLQGTTETVVPYVAEMNFDVLYLPPIHPIGASFRKGKNNTLDPTPDDVGSPWGIGSPEGGHKAIHPELGTIEDFDALVAAANKVDVEIAMDYALQCSPDHPWVKEHPEWFNHRPDGSIAYAENPPKKYQDIYPINFWPDTEAHRVALWEACKDILDYWISHGVRIFRVDNPHTKPIAFWAWLIPAIQAKHADVMFLAEAFTRPKVMAKLAEVGFTQSYTYFTWRTARWEIIEYLVEIAAGPKAEFMRPNFWPSTPDILGEPLRDAPMSAFRSRFVLAATLSPSYGMYSGYELGENEAASPLNEEYLNSEKYELKKRDFTVATSIAPLITQVNEIRRQHPALQELRNVWFHGSDNEQIIAYSKRSADDSDTVLVVVNLDPFNAHESTLSLNLEQLGIEGSEPFEALDELTGRPFYWWGSNNYVRLNPNEPAHILHIRKNT